MNMEQWQVLKDKTANLSLRERGILAATGVVLVLFFWFQFFYLPVEQARDQQTAKFENVNQQVLNYSERIADLNALLSNDPNAPLRAKQKALQADMIELTQEIEARLSHLIAPEKMADLMHSVLTDYKGLNLISARNLPVEPLHINAGGKQNSMGTESDSENQSVIFAHGFEMVLSGGYFQTLAFLEHLESMKGFYWRSLEYQVEQYPGAKIVIQISTLSLEEDWIGV